ncbi:hypothetical protein [Limimonas halophila]|uniref:hypothetical protein n=1 Tax=Limimonas halophila TaxID=1082479 RepID=UPI00115F86B1|nr:hypothetical protein [Limimonas halophila]
MAECFDELACVENLLIGTANARERNFGFTATQLDHTVRKGRVRHAHIAVGETALEKQLVAGVEIVDRHRGTILRVDDEAVESAIAGNCGVLVAVDVVVVIGSGIDRLRAAFAGQNREFVARRSSIVVVAGGWIATRIADDSNAAGSELLFEARGIEDLLVDTFGKVGQRNRRLPDAERDASVTESTVGD